MGMFSLGLFKTFIVFSLLNISTSCKLHTAKSLEYILISISISVLAWCEGLQFSKQLTAVKLYYCAWTCSH